MTAITGPSQTAARIDKFVEEHCDGFRPHLGASLLGHPCERYLWLSFRWAVREHFDGRQLRLFARGKREEAVFVHYLRAIGVDIQHTDADPAGEQVHVTLAPHVGGSVDGIIESGLPEAPKKRHIAEFKTHNKHSFDELEKKGVFEAKRRHWCQMQAYMRGTGIDRAFYMAVCKDDDRLYTERVEYQPQIAAQIVDRGARIARSDRMPEPLAGGGPSWYQCKMCGFYDFCWISHMTKEINCRTCAHITAAEDGTMRCEYHGRAVDYDIQVGGCFNHVFHPDLVPWRFCGGDETGACAIYEIDGKRVINGCMDGAVLSSDLLAGKMTPPPLVKIPF